MTANPYLSRTANVLYWGATGVAVLGTVLSVWFWMDKGNLLSAVMVWGLLAVIPYGLGYALRYILTGLLDHPFFARVLGWWRAYRHSGGGG